RPRQVEVAVAVEVAHRQGRRTRAGGGGPSRLKRAVGVAQQHADGVGDYRGQIEPSVAVEIARHNAGWGRAGRVARGGEEAGQAAVLQDVEVGPMRPGPK